MMQHFYQYIEHLQAYGDAPAVIDDTHGYTLSYLELCERIYGYAHFLATDQQCKPGDVVALYHLRGVEWVVAFFAAQLLDVTCLSFDDRMGDDICASLYKTTKATLLISPKGVSPPIAHTTYISFSFKKQRDNFDRSYIPFASRGDSKRPVMSEILLTSGTWSLPKGVMLTQQNILTNLHDNLQKFSPTPDDRLLSILPLSHAYAQMCDLFMPLYCGSQVIYTTKLDPQSLTSAMHSYSITMLICVPRVLESIHRSILRNIPSRVHPLIPYICRAARHMPLPFRRIIFNTIHTRIAPSLKSVAVGGAPLDPSLDTFFQGIGYKVLVGYGLSETSPIISMRSDTNGTPGSVGTPHDRLKLHVSSKNEVLVQGESVFAGYYPHKRTGRYFNTKDIGYMKNGELFLTGRSRNLIVYPNGDKLSIEDIEHIANTTKGVIESIVHTSDPTTLDPNDIRLIVNTSPDFDETILRARFSSILPSAARIKHIVTFTDQPLIRTHTLKLARLRNYEHFEKLLELDHHET